MQLLDEQNKRVEAVGRDERVLSTSPTKRPPSHLAEIRRLARAVEESTTCATARRLLLGTTALSSGMVANG